MKKIVISEGGSLSINRRGQLKQQTCRFNNGHAEPRCGDTCPLFGEPVEHEAETVVINLCYRQLVCDTADFEDERPVIEEEP
ncbi:hypothetical protein LCGC14_1545020 [marine sediment metagenome]|uniref:Uncharacterized protein n=1 Tax=marine sediment metagenome TaxID=412755 RepID=A0A0F9JCT2_9ZZZZ